VIACRLLLGPSRGLVWRIVGVVVIVECIGAALLMPMYGFGGGLFHAISAFCNAGFDLTGHSLSGELYTMSTHVVMTGLIVLGGLGFPVLACRKALPGHARVVLVTTAGLYLTGVVVLIAGELMPYVSHQLNLNVTANRVEPEKLRARKFGAMVADASFMSVSARSAGFYTTPMDEISPAGRVMVMGLMMVGDPVGHLGQRLVLMPRLSAQHGNRQGAEISCVGRSTEAIRHPAHQAGPIEEPVYEPRRMPEEPEFLLQEDVDAAVEQVVETDIGLICSQRCIGRDEGDVDPFAHEGGCQCVVVHAATAVHPSGASGDIGEAHAGFRSAQPSD